MFTSLKYLFQTEYNKKHKIFAFTRFLEWKMIRLFKIKNYKKRIWNDRFVLLNYDSVQSMWLMYHWIVDWEEFNLIKDLLNSGDCCVDVGANVGIYTLWMSNFTNCILSFEPNNLNFSKLKSNLVLNNLSDININNVAVGDKEGLVNFTMGNDIKNHISLVENENTESVMCRKLGNVLVENNITTVKYLKLDVEGYELSVLKGLMSFLEEKKISVIQLEINNAVTNSASTHLDLLNFLENFGYALCSYDVAQKKLNNISYDDNRENYFAVHNLDKINGELLK